MLRYFLLFFYNCLTVQTIFAQQQITDFPNEKMLTPSSFQYCGQVNDKVVFLAYRPEYNSSALWVFDGTQKGTILIKDTEKPNYSFSNFVSYDNQLYFLVNNELKREVWKTDGTVENTKKIFESDSLKAMHIVQDKLLIVLHGKQFYEEVKFALLNEADEVKIWENSAWYYTIFDDKIHYLSYNTPKYAQLKVYDGKVKTVTGLLKDKPYFSGPIKYQEHFYYYLYGRDQGEKKILISDLQNPEKNQLYDWTDHSDGFGIFVNDTAQSLHLIKYLQGHLQIYKVSKSNTLIEIVNIPNSTITTTFSYYFGQVQNPVLYNDNLVFTTVYGAEGGTHDFRIHKYNIKENTHKYSENLVSKFIWDVKITPRNGDVYELDGWNYNCLYDFSKNQLYGCVNFSSTNDSYSRVQVQTKTETFELSDNLYLINQYKKTPLLQTQTLNNPLITQFYYQDTLNNQLLFWTYNKTKKANQVWESDGLKTNLIFEYENNDIYNTGLCIEKRLLRSLIFSVYDSKEIRIFKTNGTIEGSKQLIHLESINYYLINPAGNDKLVIYRIDSKDKIKNSIVQKLVVINIETEELKIIDVSALARCQVFATTSGIYVTNHNDLGEYTSFYVLNNGKLEDITVKLKGNGTVRNLYTYANKLYYLHTVEDTYREIRYIDSLMHIRILYKDINSFFIDNKFLFISNKMGWVIADLDSGDTDIIKQEYDFFLGNISYQYEKLIFFNNTNLYIFNKDFNKQDVFVGDKIRSLQIVKNGVFIITNNNNSIVSKLWFYNFKTGILKEIIKEEDDISIELVDEELIFIRDKRGAKMRAWSAIHERFIMLPDGINQKVSIVGDIIIVTKISDYNNVYVLVRHDSVFEEKYKLNNQYYKTNTIVKTPTSFYLSYYEFQKGQELVCLTKDSIEYLPEIVKGREGIEPFSIFNFKNNIYVVASTYTYGTQIWRINQSSDEATPQDKLKMQSEPEPEKINIYPNPTQGVLTIEAASFSDIQLFQLDGKQVLNTKTTNATTTLDISSLQQGIYLLRIFNEKGVFTKKIVKF
ncbi:T9SS type A sorting domain-containing protein [Emticicia agri]|uniref:T9SS type A sorting domain-containing protein n=1 Tax=Emticicia agri TaxID=2492393 RepID=A0A4Q5LZ83_9BACT|nr:T9SS type A sorting domain-containing protein [Emticicia agri]RYU95276.1 T9SS type A sorting domain-containing protein [Emticicia agri]